MQLIDKVLRKISDGKLLIGSSRKWRIVSGAAVFLAVCAVGAAGMAPIAPDPADLPVRAISEELTIPELAEQVSHLQTVQHAYLQEEQIRSGDTLATLLTRLGVEDDAAAKFIKSDRIASQIMQLRAGRRVRAQTDADGDLQRLSTNVYDNAGNVIKTVSIQREGEHFIASEAQPALEKRVEMRSGEIRSSLFAATDTAQIPDSIAMQLVDMFSTNIDFASDLRRGDHFNVVYETLWQNGEFVRTGRVLAGEFFNAGAAYQSVWFDEPNSKDGGGYYTFDGKSLKKAFLKSPLEFTRISSGFSMRLHPISGQWKQHQGVDFAAPTGTPIRASGDGTVEFVGVQNGYGNVVVLKHWNNYSTAYAHMSRFAAGLKKGMKLSQGQLVGYVGSTGWATGPHLHYEFRVNNQPRDPMAVDVPNKQALAGTELQRFRNMAADMRHRLTLLTPQSTTKLASK